MAKSNGKKTKGDQAPQGITHLTVGGFKSIAREQTIEIRPLTVLAGANSSGKSSMIQPLLLLKQTLEATYDPGPLKLDGPNVRFTSFDQMTTCISKTQSRQVLRFGLNTEGVGKLGLEISRANKKQFALAKMTFDSWGGPFEITPNSWPDVFNEVYKVLESAFQQNYPQTTIKTEVERVRCFFDIIGVGNSPEWQEARIFDRKPILSRVFPHTHCIQEVIHLPGHRGNPERNYPVTAVGKRFAGKFEVYTASIIASWKTDEHSEKLEQLSSDLRNLSLTWKVEALPIDDTQVELRVGRLTQPQVGGGKDLVNIADVGFGVSQTLPVVVALLVAEPGQLVFLEQPEIHLHPRAQIAMAQLLANAANRGVKVVVETHSSLLLLGIQSLVAEHKLSPDTVALHWFHRNDDGETNITTAELDDAGRFGDWPEDFDDVTLQAQANYLNAAEKHRVAR
ncbi:MAG: DUF3696 domain-containing protein [Planctomycetes bacterium]|nr:DUF3696 domain-containing protein [Planctomycetota bacterium]